MVNVRFLWYLENKDVLSLFQFAFREKSSTKDILISLETYIREAFVKRTMFLTWRKLMTLHGSIIPYKKL